MTNDPLRILFILPSSRAVVRHYLPLVSELGRRGHAVELGFSKLPSEPLFAHVAAIEHAFRDVTYGVAPGRSSLDGWHSVGWLVRSLADLARYSHPRFEEALVLRRRAAELVLGRLAQPGKLDPLGRSAGRRLARRLAASTDAELSERVVRWGARLEAAIPTSGAIDRYIRERAPDVVLVSPAVRLASPQVEFLKSARRSGVPTGVCVASWDNLTNKGLLRFVPERVLVWNEVQRREAVELHGVPAGRVVATGAQVFDEWFERRPSCAREEFVAKVGLDPAEPYVLYVCSSSTIGQRREEDFVLRWIAALRSGSDPRLRRIGILVRPHPAVSAGWKNIDFAGLENATVWPVKPRRPITPQEHADFFDSLVYSGAVVGINTTAMIEGAIVGKSVLTVLAPEFAQESTLHFRYLLAEHGGFLHVGSSLEEHVVQLGRVLDDDDGGAERRRRFVESFVRPGGLDRPATPILADAVEELAGLRADAPVGFSPYRLPLAVEAGLCSVALRTAAARERLRRSVRLGTLHRRVTAKARAIAR